MNRNLEVVRHTGRAALRQCGEVRLRACAGGASYSVAGRGVNVIRHLRNATLLLTVLSVSACFRPPRAIVEPTPGEWVWRHGDLRHAAFAADAAPLAVERAYSEGLGRGLPMMPHVHGDLLIAVISGGGVVTASASTGERYWSRRFNGSVAGQALRVGDHLVFATHQRQGEVHALELGRGRRVWRTRLDQRPAAEPAVADGMLYLVTEPGRVLALDARTGDERWRREIGGVVVQPPVVHDGALLVHTRDTLVTLARADGQRTGRYPLAGTPSAAMALGGDTLVVATQEGIVAAYDVRTGGELWRHDVGAPVLAAPAITPRGVVVLNRAADVWLLDARSARRVGDLEGAATESLTVTANGMLVGLLDGTLHFLDSNGRPVWSEELGASIQAPALLHDGAVLAATVTGRLVRLAPSAQMGSQ